MICQNCDGKGYRFHWCNCDVKLPREAIDARVLAGREGYHLGFTEALTKVGEYLDRQVEGLVLVPEAKKIVPYVRSLRRALDPSRFQR